MGEAPQLEIHGPVPGGTVDHLVAEAAGLHSLHDVFLWTASQTPAMELVDLVEQDEYTQDLVIALPDGGWLVYGSTLMGAITAVAVWSTRPGPRSLLRARLKRGWTPTVSLLKDGPRVLGYAACLEDGTCRP